MWGVRHEKNLIGPGGLRHEHIFVGLKNKNALAEISFIRSVFPV